MAPKSTIETTSPETLQVASKTIPDQDDLLMSITLVPAMRSRSQFEGMPYGTQASAHNWPNCK